jgi:hypothetical protein
MASQGIYLQSSRATIFYPTPGAAAENLQNATLFTRIYIRTTPQVVADALEKSPHLTNTFLLGHYNNVLVFDRVQEEHTTHVRAVLQMLRDKGLKADIDHCAFDKPSWAGAGFYIDPIKAAGKVAFMVVLREHLAPDALAEVDREGPLPADLKTDRTTDV